MVEPGFQEVEWFHEADDRARTVAFLDALGVRKAQARASPTRSSGEAGAVGAQLVFFSSSLISLQAFCWASIERR